MPRTIIPQNYRKSDGTVIDNFSDVSSWTLVGGTFEADIVNYKVGTQGGKLTNTIGSIAKITKQGFGNFMVGKNKVALWCYVLDPTKIDTLRIFLSATSSLSKYFTGTIPGAKLDPGWNFIVLLRSEFTNTGDESWDAVAAVRLQFSAISGQSTSVTFGVLTTDPLLMPKVIISFDDCYKSVYETALPMFQAAGIKGTMYLISSYVGVNDNYYMTQAQVDALYAAGWDVANHTTSHANLTVLSDAEVISEVGGCRDYLLEHGYTRSAHHISYPLGAYNQHVIDLIAPLGILTARTVQTRNAAYSHPYNLLRYPVKFTLDDTTTAAKVISAVNDAVLTGGTLIFYGHDIQDTPLGSSTVATSVLQALVDECVRRKVDVVTVSEWYKGLTNPRKAVDR